MDSFPELVSQNILRFMDHKGILSLRLLDHSWRRRCTDYLRAKRTIIVVRFPHCAQIADINAMLEKAGSYSPFLGISFQGLQPGRDDYCKQHCCLHENVDVESLYPFLFQNVTVNYFHINYITRQTCIADKVLRRLLVSRGDSIKYLWIEWLPTSITSIIQYLDIESDSKLFSSLEAMKYYSPSRRFFPNKGDKKLIYEIVNLSPNLIACEATLKFRTLLKGKYNTTNKEINVFKTLHTDYMEPNLAGLEDLITKKIQFSTMILSPPCGEAFEDDLNNEHFNKLSKLLNLISGKCQTTLFTVHNYFFMNRLYSLSTIRMNFVNLRELRLLVAMNDYAEVHLLCLQSINYEQFCPNLIKLEFLALAKELTDPKLPGHVEDFRLFGQIHKYQEYKLKLSGAPKYKCLSVRDLTLDIIGDFPIKKQLAIWQFVSNTFPNVTDLDCIGKFSSGNLVGYLDTLPWKTSLTCMAYNWVPLDIISTIRHFCVGIGMKELAELNIESLKSWSFAPRRNTFENTAMRKLKIKLIDHQNCNPKTAYHTFSFVKHIDIIGRWIRTKMPGFEVEVSHADACDAACNPLKLDLWRNHATLHRKIRQGSPICTLRFGS